MLPLSLQMGVIDSIPTVQNVTNLKPCFRYYLLPVLGFFSKPTDDIVDLEKHITNNYVIIGIMLTV
jgi:hypothetical protein